ncbi:MAG: hypothetical protein K5651_04450 [Bacteroidales bacterium]|nr:hypothetical protein [Bacteroidales bacterium]
MKFSSLKPILCGLLLAALLIACQRKGEKGVIFHFTPNAVQMDASAGSCDVFVQYDEQPHTVRLHLITCKNEIIFPVPNDILPDYKISPEGISYPSSDYETPVIFEWKWLKIIIEPGGEKFRVITQENDTGEPRSVTLRWVDWCTIWAETIEITQAAANDDQ